MASSELTRRLLRDRIEMQRAKIEQEQQKIEELEREKDRRAKVLLVVYRPTVLCNQCYLIASCVSTVS